MNLDEMAEACNEVSRSKGWLEETRSFGDLIALMHSELSEALEEYRQGYEYNETYWTCTSCGTVYATRVPNAVTPCCAGDWKPEGIPIELADVVIRVLQACAQLGISIETAYDIKMEFNKTRPHKHGGKVI